MEGTFDVVEVFVMGDMSGFLFADEDGRSQGLSSLVSECREDELVLRISRCSDGCRR